MISRKVEQVNNTEIITSINDACNETVIAAWPECPNTGSLYLLPEYEGALEGTSTCLGSCSFIDWLKCAGAVAACAAACVDPLDGICESCLAGLGVPQCLKCVTVSYALTTETQPPPINDQGNDYCHFSNLVVQDTCNLTVEATWPECSDTLETYLDSPSLEPSLGATPCDGKCTWSKMLSCAGSIATCVPTCAGDPTSLECLDCIKNVGTGCCDCLAYAVGQISQSAGRAICNQCTQDLNVGGGGGESS